MKTVGHVVVSQLLFHSFTAGLVACASPNLAHSIHTLIGAQEPRPQTPELRSGLQIAGFSVHSPEFTKSRVDKVHTKFTEQQSSLAGLASLGTSAGRRRDWDGAGRGAEDQPLAIVGAVGGSEHVDEQAPLLHAPPRPPGSLPVHPVPDPAVLAPSSAVWAWAWCWLCCACWRARWRECCASMCKWGGEEKRGKEEGERR